MRTPSEQLPVSGPSRRTLAKGAAWSVPVILVAAPVPAMAASGATGGISATCEAVPRTGSFTFEVGGSTSAHIRLLLVNSNAASSYSVNFPSGWTVEPGGSVTTTSFLAPVTGGVAGGKVTITFELPPSSSTTMTATIS